MLLLIVENKWCLESASPLFHMGLINFGAIVCCWTHYKYECQRERVRPLLQAVKKKSEWRKLLEFIVIGWPQILVRTNICNWKDIEISNHFVTYDFNVVDNFQNLMSSGILCTNATSFDDIFATKVGTYYSQSVCCMTCFLFSCWTDIKLHSFWVCACEIS